MTITTAKISYLLESPDGPTSPRANMAFELEVNGRRPHIIDVSAASPPPAVIAYLDALDQLAAWGLKQPARPSDRK